VYEPSDDADWYDHVMFETMLRWLISGSTQIDSVGSINEMIRMRLCLIEVTILGRVLDGICGGFAFPLSLLLCPLAERFKGGD